MNEHDADDVLQNVLIVVARKLPSFDHNNRAGAFRKWLKNILANCLREFFRAGPPPTVQAQLGELEDPSSTLSKRFDEEHQAHLIHKLVEVGKSRFATEAWKIFEQAVLFGQTPAQVAEANDVSVNVVYLTKSRILQRLREEGRGLIDDECAPA